MKNTGWKHRLTNKNLESMTADCLTCGPGVRIINVSSDKIRCWWGRQKGGTYGDIKITHLQKRAMFEGKNFCAICKSVIVFENAVLDHCHDSQAVRDFLCNKCNLGLGLFNDNPELMRSAATYLELWKEKYEEI